MKIMIGLEFDNFAEAAATLARLAGTDAKDTATPKPAEAQAPAPKPTKAKTESPPAAASPPSAAVDPSAASHGPLTESPASSALTPAPTPPPGVSAPPLSALSEVVARAVNANRAGTIAKLAEYGAKKASEVPEDKRVECIAALKGLVDAAAVAG